jgi:hypothetical protein
MKVMVLDYHSELADIRGRIVGHLNESRHKKMKIHTPSKVFIGVQGTLGSVSVVEEDVLRDQG